MAGQYQTIALASPPPYPEGPEKSHPETQLLLPSPSCRPVEPRSDSSLRRRRRLRIAVCATLLFLLCAHVIVGCFQRRGHFIPYRSFGSSDKPDIDPRWTRDCIKYAEWSKDGSPSFDQDDSDFESGDLDRFAHSARTSFALPLSSDLLYLVSHGALTYGNVHITHESADADDVKVDIIMAYDHEVAFENAEVCLLQAAEGKNGVGIFRPKDLRCRWSRECEQYRASFEVWVRIPSGAEENGPTVVKKFETDMSLFAHRLHQLEGKVFFDAINLQTSNSRIISESLGAGYATLRTSNGPISGTFNASHRLDLRTSNAPIDVDVQLLDAGDDDGTDLIMRTSNNHIEATTTLVSADVDRTNGTFSIDARTSNAHLSLAVPSAPVSHVLTLTARTSNARTSASLPSSWEGDFRLQTSLYTPTVNAHTEVPDPSGQDRRRSVAVHTVRKGTVDGRAAWVPTEERKTGVVNMRTSNAQLTLGL